MIFQWEIQLNNGPAVKRFFKLRRGESIDHLALKLVGFILFMRFTPEVEKSII